MKWKYWLTLAAAVLLSAPAQTFAQPLKSQLHNVTILRNRDVLLMVRRGMKPDLVVATILTSNCNFDVFPPVLDDLKRRGIPENVLQVMSVVPNGPPNLPDAERPTRESLIRSVRMPQGTPILVETLYPVSSADFKINNTVAFSVVSSIYVDGVLTIPRGTVARARIVKVKRAKHFGRGGALTFEMEQIVAIDGTRIPVQLTFSTDGGNRTGQMAAGAAATSALIFPYTAPAAIVWGFKKGDEAVIRGNKQFAAVIKTNVEVAGLLPDDDRVIYHYAESLKAKAAGSPTPTKFPRLGVRN